MTVYYLDSSALLKAYLPEKGSTWVGDLVATESIVISMLTVAEVASALARRVREGAITPSQRQRSFDTFLAHTGRFEVVQLSSGLIEDAASVFMRDAPVLRTLDALHLATAQRSFILAQRDAAERGVLVVADRRLRDAAVALGLSVDNPEDHE